MACSSVGASDVCIFNADGRLTTAVWGQMSTGGGHSALEETMSTMGVPVMTKNGFIDTERVIGEMWKQELLQSMAEAGREERQLVMEGGEYHEGFLL